MDEMCAFGPAGAVKGAVLGGQSAGMGEPALRIRSISSSAERDMSNRSIALLT